MTWVRSRSLTASLGYKVFNTPLYVWITGMYCALIIQQHTKNCSDNLQYENL